MNAYQGAQRRICLSSLQLASTSVAALGSGFCPSSSVAPKHDILSQIVKKSAKKTTSIFTKNIKHEDEFDAYL